MSDRIAVFIDGQALYAASRALGFEVDYRKLLRAFRDRDPHCQLRYYTALAPRHDDDNDYRAVQPLLDWLGYNGFMVTTKEARAYENEGRTRYKSSFQIELVCDAFAASAWAQTVVLMTGDGDYRLLVERLQARGVWVQVVSTIATQPAFCSDALRRQADDFVELKEFLPGVARTRDTAA